MEGRGVPLATPISPGRPCKGRPGLIYYASVSNWHR